MTALASGSSSAAAFLNPVNPSIATISMFSRQVSGWEASQVLKTCLDRPGTMSRSRQGPLWSRMGVKSKVTVTYLSPYGVWCHTPYGDKYVTVILDLTPIRDLRGPSRLLDMVPGRSKKVFKTWLASRPDTWRERIEIVAMDGFTGFKSAAAEELPDARAVMDPFHVVHLAGDALDECRRCIQQELHHRRGRATDPLYKARRMLHTRSCLLTPRQQHQLLNLFSGEEHVALEVTWSAYQNIIDAYRAPDTDAGKALMEAEINTLTSTRVPRGLTELITLGRTLKRRAGDILAYFDHPHTSNGPTEAINGRLEHLRGSALGFRNLTHYITRCLLETGGFRPQLHPQL